MLKTAWIRSALITATVLLAAASASAENQKVTISPEQSTLSWVGKKLTGQHNGKVRLQSGNAELSDGRLVGGEFKVDLRTIVVEDIQDPKYNAKLTDHLKSDDFFSVDKYPISTFKITKVEALKQEEAGGPNYQISGDLTIKGISHPLSFPARVEVGSGKAAAHAGVTVDRTLWNIRYGSGKFFQGLGDKLIYDEFSVELNLSGTY